MKNVLFATTALIAVASFGAANAGDVKLSLDGFARVGLGVGGHFDGANVEKDFHIIQDGEIHFKGQGVLDNGLEITTRVELEAFSVTDQIDENWVRVKSNLGSILIGGNDDAGYNINSVGIMDVSIGVSNFDTTYDFSGYFPGDTIGGRDAYGVHYYSPKVFGFEFGVSYQPDLSDPNAGYTSSDAGNVSGATERTSVGASFGHSFGDVSFKVGGSFIYDHDDGAEHTAAYAVGLTVGFHGFEVGGRYEAEDSTGATGDVDRYGLGVTYATGPWAFGVAAAYVEEDTAENSWLGAGFSYELGNGVGLGGAVTYGEVDNDAGRDEEGFGANILLGINF